jgi:Cytochrome C oxidase, cbb3-type, subunit III
MQKRWPSLPIFFILAILITLGITSWISPGTVVPLQQGTPTSPSGGMLPTEDSWIIVDLPANATQLEYGAEVYRLVCKACHGDKGQGLTDDWRAQWAPEDQNCWQSKCHALNHPPDGFYMPQVPKVLGQPIRGFNTALNLYTYIHNYMPWHDRGSMTEKESWSVTAYILKINGVDPIPELNAETAANVDLSVIDPNLGPTPVPPSPEVQSAPLPENTQTPIPTSGHENQNTGTIAPVWVLGIVLLIILIFVAAIMLGRRTTV